MNRKFIRRLAGDSVMKRVDAVRHELRYGPPAAWSRWRSARDLAAKRKKLRSWHDQLHANPPDVLAGANIGNANGITHHIEAIRDHSKLRVEIAPPEWLMKDLSYHDLHTVLRSEVMAFAPTGIRVVHSHVFPYFIQWARLHRDEIPLWVHTYHLPYFPVGAKALEAWQVEYNRVLVEDARHAHVKISVSRWQQKFLADEHGIESTYIPNGVSVSRCDRGNAGRFREVHGTEPFILYVGRNDPVKNPADFVRLAQRLPQQRFVMIGGGLSPESLAKDWGVECPSNFVAIGSATRDEVQDALAACSLLVVTSLREGLPTLVLEALTHGRSVVVPDEAGSVEAIDGGEYGFIYTPGDIADLVSKTLTALAQPIDGGKLRQRILSEYDWRVVAQKLDSVFESQ